MKCQNILLIEDSKSFSDYLKSLLDELGYHTRVLQNGSDAFDFLFKKNGRPDVIILDYHLPDMEGVALIKELKNKQLDLGLIVITADTTLNTVLDAMRAGAHDFIQKKPGLEKEIGQVIEKVYEISTNASIKKKLEAEIVENNKILKSITESAQDGIIMTNEKDEVIFWNQAAEKIFGYTFEEIRNHKMHEILAHPEFIPSHKPAYEKFTHSGLGNAIGKTMELKSITKNKTTIDIELSLSAINSKGKWHAIGIVRDVTERKNNEEKIKQYTNELSEINKTKDKLFSIIAHDLKNPMQQILGFSELLMNNLDKFDQEKINKFINYIYIAALQNSDLLNNLLNWSRSQLNSFVINVEKIKLMRLAVESYEVMESSAINKRITITKNVDPDLCIMADYNMMYTVVRNLLSNAIKFSEFDSEIKIYTKVENSVAQLCIADNGVGIDQETINQIFVQNNSVSTQGTKGETGTGLGLRICIEFIEKNKGNLLCKSKPGEGTEFIIEFPVAN